MNKLPDFFFVDNLKGSDNSRLRKLQQYYNILSYLYYNKKSSIAQIMKSVKLSQPLVAALIDDMIGFGIVVDMGVGKSIGGRKPNLFQIYSNYQFVLCVEISLSSISIAMFNLNNELILKQEYKDFELTNSNDYLDSLISCVNDFIADTKIDRSRILSLGVSLPGLVDSRLGETYTHLNFTDKSISDHLSGILKMPVLIDNDARTMALGEKHFGKAIGLKNVLCLNLSYGIGLGIILNGELYAGKNGYAGEFGHILLDPNGSLCTCGKIGCLETVCSGHVLIKNIIESIEEGKDSMIAERIRKGEKLKLKLIVESINKGDQFCIDQLRIIGENLGMGLVSLIHLLNPEMIILGGKLAQAKQYIVDPINISLNRYAMDRIRKETNILTSDLLDDAPLYGALANVMNKILCSYTNKNTK